MWDGNINSESSEELCTMVEREPMWDGNLLEEVSNLMLKMG